MNLEGGYTLNCDGTKLAPCAALRAMVPLDTCTLAVKKQLDAVNAAERNRIPSPGEQALRDKYNQSPAGLLQQSASNFYSQRAVFLCVSMHENDVNVLEICKIDPKSNYAAGAVDFVAKIRPAVPRGPGMTIGGWPARATPWVNAHCTPKVVGYTCKWNGIVLDYQ